MLSHRARAFERSNEISQLLAEKREAGRSIWDLTLSNPTAAGLSYPATELAAALAEAQWTRYRPDPRGLVSARAAIAEFLSEHGIPADAERMLLTASTSEAYAYLFKLLCDPGDEILTPEPSYPLLAELARYEGVRVGSYGLTYDGAWHIDFSTLESRARDAKAILVVSPNNPTGSLLRRDELERLLSLQTPLIIDEVFWPYLHEPRSSASALALDVEYPVGSLIFRLDGLSKLAALPQLKLGWLQVTGDDQAAAQALHALEFMADAYLSVGTPVQAAAGKLLRLSQSLRDQLKRRLANNLSQLQKLLADAAVTKLHLEAGWYAILELPRPEESADADWALTLLREHDVLVQPGWFYDLASPRAVVVSLLTPPDVFEQGVLRLVRAAGA